MTRPLRHRLAGLAVRFALEYISHAGALRYYYPDFVLRLDDDTCLIVETKGQEDLDVALKDRRARRWCQDATRLSGREWAYEKVPQKLFDSFNGDTVEGLRRFLGAAGSYVRKTGLGSCGVARGVESAVGAAVV